MTESPTPVATPAGIPEAEVHIDETVIRELLRSQHPDLADLPLRHVATGWDNATYQLGDRLAVRLPRIAAAVGLLRNEQHWLPRLADRLPVPVPTPVRVGEPAAGFPWPWSVVPWVPGRSGEHEPLDPAEAATFGRFLAAVHQPAPEGFPRNDYRGVSLASVADSVTVRLDRLSEMAGGALAGNAMAGNAMAGNAMAGNAMAGNAMDGNALDGGLVDGGIGVSLAAVRERWRRSVAAPVGVTDRCVHGDLHPKNLVVDGGRLAAVLDWGDMTAGDPAIDLGAAWMLFPTGAHQEVWDAYGPVSSGTLERAAGWAVFFGVMLLEVGLINDPPFATIGRLTLARVCAG